MISNTLSPKKIGKLRKTYVIKSGYNIEEPLKALYKSYSDFKLRIRQLSHSERKKKYQAIISGLSKVKKSLDDLMKGEDNARAFFLEFLPNAKKLALIAQDEAVDILTFKRQMLLVNLIVQSMKNKKYKTKSGRPVNYKNISLVLDLAEFYEAGTGKVASVYKSSRGLYGYDSEFYRFVKDCLDILGIEIKNIGRYTEQTLHLRENMRQFSSL